LVWWPPARPLSVRPITSRGASPVVIAYTITDDDVRGPFVPKIPRDFEGMARLHGLGYRSAAPLLAEKIHTSEELIKLLNPGKTLDRAGTVTVPNAADGRPAGQVFRIEVDEPAKVIRALGRGDELVAFCPASVGSREKPAPSGTYGVRRVVHPRPKVPIQRRAGSEEAYHRARSQQSRRLGLDRSNQGEL